jgi:hypothetical protein
MEVERGEHRGAAVRSRVVTRVHKRCRGPELDAPETLEDRLAVGKGVELHISDAIEDSRRRGSSRGFALCLCFGSSLRYRLGELERASEDARGAFDAFAADPLLCAYVLGFLLEPLIDRGSIGRPTPRWRPWISTRSRRSRPRRPRCRSRSEP